MRLPSHGPGVAEGAEHFACSVSSRCRQTRAADEEGRSRRSREVATARAGIRGGLPTRTMATALRYHRPMLGDSGLVVALAALTSQEGAFDPASGVGPRVITVSTLHTFPLFCSVKDDLEYLASSLPWELDVSCVRKAGRPPDGLEFDTSAFAPCHLRHTGERIRY